MKSAKLARELQDIEFRMGEIDDMSEDSLTDEIRTERRELTTKKREVYDQYTAAQDEEEEQRQAETTTTLDTTTPEQQELWQLETRARNDGGLGAIVGCVLGQTKPDGSIAELQQREKLAPNVVPLALMRSPQTEEHRTSGITQGPTDSGADQRPIIPAIFPDSAMAFLGINGQTAMVGESVHAVVSTSVSPGLPGEGSDQAHSTAAFTSVSLSPTRAQGSCFFSVEDAARVMGLSEALRQNIMSALSNELDEQVIANSTYGLFHDSAISDNAASAVDTYSSAKTRIVYSALDGTYAGTASDLRILLGSDTYSFLGGLYRTTTAGDDDAMQVLNRMVSGTRISPHVPAKASDKQELLVVRGMAQHTALALWGGVELIEDPYSMAKSGEIIVTGRLLFGFDVLRGAGYRKVETQHA